MCARAPSVLSSVPPARVPQPSAGLSRASRLPSVSSLARLFKSRQKESPRIASPSPNRSQGNTSSRTSDGSRTTSSSLPTTCLPPARPTTTPSTRTKSTPFSGMPRQERSHSQRCPWIPHRHTETLHVRARATPHGSKHGILLNISSLSLAARAQTSVLSRAQQLKADPQHGQRLSSKRRPSRSCPSPRSTSRPTPHPWQSTLT